MTRDLGGAVRDSQRDVDRVVGRALVRVLNHAALGERADARGIRSRLSVGRLLRLAPLGRR